MAKLELLPDDAPYSRHSNAQAPIEIENLELRLPVREKPGSGGGIVQEPKPVVIPDGYEPAIDFKTPATTPGSQGPQRRQRSRRPRQRQDPRDEEIPDPAPQLHRRRPAPER